MAVAPRNTEAAHIIAAPTGPLVVPAIAAGAAQPVLSLVVPTLNESENIVDFLAAVRHTLDQALPGRYEVIVVDDDGAVVIPRALLNEVVESATEQEKLEAWIIGEVQAGASLPGLYPPNAENKARYEAFRKGHAKAI